MDLTEEDIDHIYNQTRNTDSFRAELVIKNINKNKNNYYKTSAEEKNFLYTNGPNCLILKSNLESQKQKNMTIKKPTLYDPK